MNVETVTFSPIGYGGDWISVGFGAIACLGILVVIYQLNIKRQARNSEFGSTSIIILVAIATLLAGAAFVYSVQVDDELKTVEISTNYIRTPFGKCEAKDIKSVYLFPQSQDQQLPSDSIEEKYLIFEEVNGHRHPLPASSYDIDSIYTTWKRLSKK